MLFECSSYSNNVATCNILYYVYILKNNVFILEYPYMIRTVHAFLYNCYMVMITYRTKFKALYTEITSMISLVLCQMELCASNCTCKCIFTPGTICIKIGEHLYSKIDFNY